MYSIKSYNNIVHIEMLTLKGYVNQVVGTKPGMFVMKPG